jgi:hypothetical protein
MNDRVIRRPRGFHEKSKGAVSRPGILKAAVNIKLKISGLVQKFTPPDFGTSPTFYLRRGAFIWNLLLKSGT